MDVRDPILGRSRPDRGTGVDNAFAERHGPGIGAEIMGAGKFGPPGWQDDAEWRGWWGPNPPFHTPMFVLTHRPRPSLEMEGGTTFHFLDAAPKDALPLPGRPQTVRTSASVAGPTMLREFLAAGLVDHLHVVQVPILLGRGVRLWDGLEGSRSSTMSRRCRRRAASPISPSLDEGRRRATPTDSAASLPSSRGAP